MTTHETGLPWVELHTHLEGSLTPRRLIALAERHGQPGLPARCLTAEGTAYHFTDFQDFLKLYRDITSVIRTPADFHSLVLDLGAQLADDAVGYAEVSVSLGVMLRRRIAPRPVLSAMAEAAAEVATTRGVVMRWIPDAVRQWGVDDGWRAWEAAFNCGHELGVVGFGLGGDETSGPVGDFAELFGVVKAEGYGVSIHAGEIPGMGSAGADSVRQAVTECGAQRVGHGLAAAGNPELLALLSARQVCVEMCPRSNVATGGLSQLAEFPLAEFLAAGVPCCLNTDDRTLFGLDLRGEYAAAQAELGLTNEQRDSMLSAARKAAFGPVGGSR